MNQTLCLIDSELSKWFKQLLNHFSFFTTL
jgi:hypothetical protein